MLGRIGPSELILILIIALVVFGPKKLPEIGKALGEAVRGFKQRSENLIEDADKTTTNSAAAIGSTAPKTTDASAPAPAPTQKA
jgi:sec-independent protein translocase protein TatA